MYRVKRTKSAQTGKKPDGEPIVQTTELYASAVSPNGVIGRWSAKAKDATLITGSVAERVKAYYATRPNVGTFEFEEVQATASQLADATAAVQDLAAKDFAALQAEVKSLQTENAGLKSDLAVAKAAATKAESKAVSITDELKTAQSQIADLRSKVSSLESELAQATAPKPADEPKADEQKAANKKSR